MTWVNAVVQGVLLGGYLRAARLRARADVRADADHQPRARRHRGARRLPDLVVLDHWNVSPFLGLVPVLPVMLLARLPPAADGARAQPSLRRARAAADDLRPLDRDPEPAAREVLARRPLARRPGRARSRPRAGRSRTRSRSRRSARSPLGVAVADPRRAPALPLPHPAGRRMRATAQDPDTAELVGDRLAHRLCAGDRDRGRDRSGRRGSSSRSARPSIPSPGRRS